MPLPPAAEEDDPGLWALPDDSNIYLELVLPSELAACA